MKINTLVINLDQSKKRWIDFKNKNSHELKKFERLSATDGNKLYIKDIQPNYIVNFPNNFQNKRMGGDLAAMISHQRCWENASENKKDDFTLVLEDDCILPTHFQPKLNKLINTLPGDWDVFKLYHNRNIKKEKDINSEIFKAAHNAPRTFNTGLVGYCINKKGATKYLELSKPLEYKDWKESHFHGCDNFWKRYWNKLNIYMVKKNLITHTNNQKSDRKDTVGRHPK
jgi:GR25 family glycosyltransferase involved in LPS biosynthesis